MKNILTLLIVFCLSIPAFSWNGGGDKELPRKSNIEFIKNNRQWDESVHYRAAVPGGFLFVRKNALQYSFYDFETVHLMKHPHDEKELDFAKNNTQIKAHSFLVEFVGAEMNSELKPEKLQAHYYNFFLGDEREKWATNTEVYEEIQYKNLYEGVDMRFFHNGTTLKYEFHLKAGASHEKILMRYNHTDDLEIDNGNLVVKTSVATVIEQKPYCYQIIDGKEVEVRSRFELDNKTKTVSFKLLEKANPAYPLVIDPILVFSTFSGASSDNWGNSATYDKNGNLYSLGTSFGAGFPVTFGAFSVTFTNQVDVGLMKYNPSGTGLLYGAFIGGGQTEVPHSSIVNQNNELVIMGTTSSNDFPTSFGAYDTSFNGGSNVTPMSGMTYTSGSDIFVMVISQNGSTLLGSTFLGGSGNDGVNLFDYNVNKLTYNYGDQFRGDIAIDGSNNIYITSTTRSNDFPLVNAAISTSAGLQEAVVVKFAPYLTAINWSTLFGGNRLDAGYSIKISGTGEVYVGGGTNSSNLPVHSGAVQPLYGTMGDILADGFIARFSAVGGYLGSTYVGTPDYDQVFFLDIDIDNNVYCFGQTRGSMFMNSTSIYGPIYQKSGSGQFIQKYNPALTSRFFSTLVGSGRSTPDISPTAFMVNSCGHIYLSGWGGNINNLPGHGGSSNVSGMPTSADAIKPSTDGDDFYIMILSPNAGSFLYGTFFGSAVTSRGDHVDGGTSRFDKDKGTIYHATCACSGNDFPITPGAWSATNNSPNCNNASFKIAFDTLDAKIQSYSMAGVAGIREGCNPLKLRFKNLSYGGRTFEWYNGTTFISNDPNEIVIAFPGPGIFNVKLVIRDPLICNGIDSAMLQIKVFPADFRVERDTSICKGQSAPLKAFGSLTYNWFPTTGLSNPNIFNPIATPTVTTTYSVAVTNATGCKDTLKVTVTVLPPLKADFTFKIQNPCDSLQKVEIKNLSEGGNYYFWDFGNGTTSTAFDPPIQTYTFGTYTIKLVVKNTICNDSIIIRKPITIYKNKVKFMADTTVCYGARVRLWASGGQSYIWTPNAGVVDTLNNSIYVTVTQTTIFTVKVRGLGNCLTEKQIKINVLPEVNANFDLSIEGVCENKPVVKITNKSTNATSYFWDFGNGTTSTVVNPSPIVYTRDGVYTILLIVKNANGCPDTLKQTIPIFINGFSVGPDTVICYGASTRLFAAGGESYSWLPATGLDNPKSPTPLATPLVTTNYVVTIVGKGGCTKKDTVKVTVLDEVKADFDIKLTTGCDTLPWVIIEDKSLGAVRYYWDFGNGKNSTDKQPKPYKYVKAGTYTITLIVWSTGNRCPDTLSKIVTIKQDNFKDFVKNIRVSDDKTICAGESTPLLATGGQKYAWSPPAGLSATNIANPIASPAVTTTYTVRISNEGGCYVDSAVTISVLPFVEPKFSYQVSSDCGKASTLLFKNETSPSGNFIWLMGNGDTLKTFEPNSYTYKQGGTYQVSLITANGVCSQSKTMTIEVDNVMPPNIITPNGDNKNDKFVIQSARSGWKLVIFDRWEKEIYRSDNYTNDWGPTESSTVFYYLLTSPDGNTCRGWIQVLGNK